MAEKPKLYWLQLKADFFKRSDIQLIKAMPNGREYALFYVELLCESLNRYGELRATETIPYNVEMLAAVTQENPDMVRSAIKVFEELGLLEVLDDGAYFMREVENMIGSASATPEAIRQREHRQRLREVERDTSVTKCHESIEIRDKRLEVRDKNLENREESIDNITPPYIPPRNVQAVIDAYNETCVSLPRVQKLTKAREKTISARLKTYSVTELQDLFTKAESVPFLKGQNDRGWKANFDWLLNETNMTKVLEGYYDGIGYQGKGAKAIGETYSAIDGFLAKESAYDT